jgi:putative ABC transport system substrate-binding protein
MKVRRAAFKVVFTVAVLAVSFGAEALQARKLPRIGVLAWEKCPKPDSVFGAALSDLGYTWGQTIHVLCRSAEEDHGRLPDAAADLAAQNVDVIAAFSHITAYAARRATRSTPIVMIASGDPVKSGLVVSLARPGGNVTGVTYYGTELVDKRLQLLKEIVPRATRVAILGNPESDHVFGLYRQDAERAAFALGLQLVMVDVSQARDLGRSFDTFVQNGAQGLLVLTDPMLRAQAHRIADLAAKHRIPAMYWGPWFMEAGGLAAYSADYDAMVRRTAYYVDRILKGARPADIPVEQPTRFELVINLKTAKALGLTIPPSLLARADKVIE